MPEIKNLPKIEEGNFKEMVKSVVDEGRHIDYLQKVLKNYEWYQNEFAKVFVDDGEPGAVYVFRVVYQRKPNLWREVAILGKQSFEQLARAIVLSMKWHYDHMHGFTFPGIEKKPEGNFKFEAITRLDFFAPGWEDDPFPTYKSNQIKICQIDYQKHPTFDFIFDFGDGHEFQIIYKRARGIKPAEKKTKFPVVIDQRGVAPEQYPAYE